MIKMLMLGANTTMRCSVLRHAVDYIRNLEKDLREWMETHEYESVKQMQRSMSQVNCPNPSTFQRAKYMKALQNYQPSWGKVYTLS
jgi:dihydroorotate dehydrogenase (fumarate)